MSVNLGLGVWQNDGVLQGILLEEMRTLHEGFDTGHVQAELITRLPQLKSCCLVVSTFMIFFCYSRRS